MLIEAVQLPGAKRFKVAHKLSEGCSSVRETLTVLSSVALHRICSAVCGRKVRRRPAEGFWERRKRCRLAATGTAMWIFLLS